MRHSPSISWICRQQVCQIMHLPDSLLELARIRIHGGAVAQLAAPIISVAVDNLSQQRDFAHALCNQPANFRHNLGWLGGCVLRRGGMG